MIRTDKLQKLQEETRSCVVITGDPNVFYFSNYRGAGVLISCDGNTTLLVPLLEENRALEIKDLDVKIYYPYKIADNIIEGSLVTAITKLVSSKSIALDVSWSPTTLYQNLSNKFQIIDISNEVSLFRSVKEDDELLKIKKAGEITSEAMRVSAEKILNNTEKQVSGIIDYTMKISGAEDYAFPSIVAGGKNSSYPHHIPSDYKITSNDNVVIDIGAKYQGYCFDSTRTFNVKNSEVKKIYEIVLEAQLEAIDAVSAGVEASEIDRIARRVIEKAGYGNYFIHSTGHGVGIEVHEYPYIGFTSNDILKENMVVTVEPGIYLPGKFGVRIEDTMIVTNRKPIVLETAYKLL
ncbi:M24 family metallopeptidase [Acidianus sulfidivorans JP7]|uniref:Aminopeptidase P family protein n=1 Tax=Acidianus sulfidivorans JP7 TaxID=619593 RepID=A0A2U9INY1_9CREN|nr:aminopeptidase P family protein [Acidianus sulfidivorans]AWR97697.1 M24 family metallopeptidase [Acidianus sulfidivorans JP7]